MNREVWENVKLAVCLLTAAVAVVTALWGLAWTLAALSVGVVSVTHVAALLAGSLTAFVSARMAARM